MTNSRNRSDSPTGLEMLDALLPLVTGIVLAAPMLPGFLLAAPALISVAVAVLMPLVVTTALVALAGALVTIPYLLVRGIRNISSRLAANASAARTMTMSATQIRG